MTFKCSLLIKSVFTYQSNIDVSKKKATIYGPHALFRGRNSEVQYSMATKDQVQTCDCTHKKEKSA